MSGSETGSEWREQWIVDGLEDSPRGRLARVELPSGRTRVLYLSELPEGVREGELLDVRGGVEGLRFTRLEAETRRRRAQAQARLEAINAASLSRDGPQRSHQQGLQDGGVQLTPDGEITL
ncbi:Protein of unknown function [Deinococcus reticulitermitis]|uniref:DUF3006 domain-containing protein n=1 Tax=Deinococcus reticulitermitis TaxID=856736 RepID=A0A1H6TZQ1_9DEIO|nr:DUF3006 family protein [Deinococcus reticulitermitis]SEI83684.1 Protein of unknown function [Deinococcus reticulitermitis]